LLMWDELRFTRNLPFVVSNQMITWSRSRVKNLDVGVTIIKQKSLEIIRLLAYQKDGSTLSSFEAEF
jgi:hypothetical protein